MLKNKIDIIELIVLLLSVLILSNYLSLFIAYNSYLIKFHVASFLLILFFFIFYKKFYFLHIKITFIILTILLLGNATEAWDSWAVWTFKAKRIYFDQSIFGALKDNYAIFQHNDYPLLAPSFAASFGVFFGSWNEIFPKVAFLFIAFPPLILSIKIFINSKLNLIFFCLSLYLINVFFINGFIDGLVSIYFIFSAYLLFNIFIELEGNNLKILNLFCFLTMLSLLKNEGILIILILFFSVLLINFLEKKLFSNIKLKIIMFLSLIPVLFWKYLTIKNQIIPFHFQNKVRNNLTESIYNSETFFTKFQSIDTYRIIFDYFITSYSLIISLIFFYLQFTLLKIIKLLFL